MSCVFADPGPMAAPLGLQGAMVSYLVTDALEEDAGSRFRRGDEVCFKVGGVTYTQRWLVDCFKLWPQRPLIGSLTPPPTSTTSRLHRNLSLSMQRTPANIPTLSKAIC